MSHRNNFTTTTSSPPSTPTSSSPSPSFSSCELPSPRSSTESNVSETLPSHIAGNDKLLEFQSLTKPEPIRLLHITSPSPDFQVGSSPSRWHEDVVETVKAGLKELQADVVHVYHGIGTEEFNELYELLSEARLRFDFDADLKTLIVRMSGPLHEAGVTYLSKTLADGMDRQQLDSGEELLPWQLGTCLLSRLEDSGSSGKATSKSKYIADVTIQNLVNESLFVSEIARAQSRENAVEKIDDRFDKNANLIGSIIISIDEDPKYERPKRKAKAADALPMGQWKETVQSSPKLGPIMYNDHCWVGSITCSLDIRLKGEDQPRIERLSIIPKSGSDDLKASAAFSDLWYLLVKGAVGEDVDPVQLVVNWDMFRAVLVRSLGPTAVGRYLDWNGGRKVQD